MKYFAENQKLTDVKADYYVLTVYQDQTMSPSTQQVDKKLGGLIGDLLANGAHRGEPGEILAVHTEHEQLSDLILIGAGSTEPTTEKEFLKIAEALGTVLKRFENKTICNNLAEIAVLNRNANWCIRQLIIRAENQAYTFTECKSSVKKSTSKPKPSKVIFYVQKSKMVGTAELAIQEAQAISQGMKTARLLGDLPANICTPSYLAKHAKAMEKKYKKVKCKVHTEAELKKMGMGSLLSVTAGSHEPAKLIVLEYRGNRATKPPVALIGKGITFDTGGISLKPGAGMDEMKYDMCGAASIIGTVEAAAEIELPINVVAVLACSENVPDAKATKPGDIVTSMSGQTVEILNTDAEGRLVLCDAITYAGKFKPDVVIDVATLTGAMIIAMGNHVSGLMSNDDDLANELLKAGQDIYDRTWRFPLWDEYQDQLESNFADMANIGGRPAGSITAGCFLARFAKEYRWAHLDIAGVAWNSGKNKGATGRPVTLLTQYLLNRCNK